MAMKARYTVANGEVIAQKRGGVRSLLVPDPLGSTIALFDATQTKTDTFSYFPYGEVKTRTGATTLPFQYVGTLGYYNDSSTRTYVRARYLDTQKGRWVTEDPIAFGGMDWNLHRYARNSPASFVDPSGLAIPCVLPCAPCFACVIDMGIVCAGEPNFWQCVVDTWKELPGWTKWLCGIACGLCIACAGRELIKRIKPKPPKPPKYGQCTGHQESWCFDYCWIRGGQIVIGCWAVSPVSRPYCLCFREPWADEWTP